MKRIGARKPINAKEFCEELDKISKSIKEAEEQADDTSCKGCKWEKFRMENYLKDLEVGAKIIYVAECQTCRNHYLNLPNNKTV